MQVKRALLAAGAAWVLSAGAASAQIELQWWHSMTAVNGERVNKIAQDFNASQKDYKVVAVFKGGYAESLNAAIAAYRAGNAPHIVQVFEVGTATMMAAKGAIKPVHQMMQEAGEKFDPNAYLPTVTGYYSTADGKMLSMPFNSSTALMYLNNDLFQKAGLDPSKPPKTWPEVFEAAKKIRASGANCGFTAGWITWTQIENFSAMHNVPIGTKANGMAGLDTEFKINSPLHVKHVENLVQAQKDNTFVYSGRTTEPEAKFLAGDCGMIQTSASFYGNVKKNAKFKATVAFLPYYPDVQGAPQNSIIGGASLWVMNGKKPEEYKGIAKFFTYLSGPEVQAEWHKATGYVPITKAAYEAVKKSGFYEQDPFLELPIKQLNNKEPTENSRGLRFGNFVQIRDIWAEELESAFAGKQSAKQALENADKRGDAVLRQFERAAK